MKVKTTCLISVLAFLIFSCKNKQSNLNVQDEASRKIISVEATAIESITHEDSIFVQGYLDQLKGIEKFSVRNDFALFASLLKYKGDTITAKKINAILQKKDEYVQSYEITVLDTKNGYIVFSPIGTEVTYTEVHWTMKDGSSLIAMEAWGCGPICSSDIYFTRFNNGKYEKQESTSVIPDKDNLPIMLVPNYNEAKELDPFEFKYVLPRQGKNIRFCLEKDCKELVWKEGTFVVEK